CLLSVVEDLAGPPFEHDWVAAPVVAVPSCNTLIRGRAADPTRATSQRPRPWAGRDEVKDQPCKTPLGHPTPHLTELSDGTVPPLRICRFLRRGGPSGGDTRR